MQHLILEVANTDPKPALGLFTGSKQMSRQRLEVDPATTQRPLQHDWHAHYLDITQRDPSTHPGTFPLVVTRVLLLENSEYSILLSNSGNGNEIESLYVH